MPGSMLKSFQLKHPPCCFEMLCWLVYSSTIDSFPPMPTQHFWTLHLHPSSWLRPVRLLFFIIRIYFGFGHLLLSKAICLMQLLHTIMHKNRFKNSRCTLQLVSSSATCIRNSRNQCKLTCPFWWQGPGGPDLGPSKGRLFVAATMCLPAPNAPGAALHLVTPQRLNVKRSDAINKLGNLSANAFFLTYLSFHNCDFGNLRSNKP